jgi:SH3 domain protein
VQDTSDRPFQNLVSGTELAILERVPNFARVRTIDGQEGWVKSAYLVSEKPAQLRVAEVEAEIDQLRAELAAAVAAQSQAQAEAGRVSKEMAQSLSSGDAIRETLGRLQQENEEFERRLEQYRGAIPWSWVAIALGVALVAGFLSGMWWLDNSIRRRFGGFRPY